MKAIRKFSFKVFFATTIFSLFTGIVCAQDQNKWTGHIEFFGKPGSDRSLAKGDLFLPFYQNEEFLLFGNLKANFDDHSNKEGNAGVGARRLYDEWIVGSWVFLDWKESTNSNSFNQVNVGGELLSNDWDFRINGYFAESERKDADNASVVEINGNQIQARLGEERALPGFDFEIGRKLPFLEDSRLFLGAYHYDASDFQKVSGPRARLEMRFHDLPLISLISKDSRLTLGAEYTEDSVRGSETFALIQLRIPFGRKSQSQKPFLTSLEKRMVETVVRDDDIIINEAIGDKVAPLVNPNTGQVISSIQTVDAMTTNVSNTVTNAGQNSLIVADGSQGGINVGGSTINTQPGQIIAGGGESILLQAKKPNGRLINMTYTPPGLRPSISRTGSGDLLYVNNDDGVIVNGVDLSGGRPIRINNSSNVSLNDTNILSSASNRQGIYLQNNSNVEFTNVMVSNTGRQGVLLQTNSSASFKNLTVSDTGREGIYMNGNSFAVFDNLSITNTGREGIELASATATLGNANISNTTQEGLRIRNGSSITVNNIAITKSRSEAIEVNNSILNLSNASITDIDVNNNRDGIYATNNSTLNLDNILIDNVTSQGIITTNNTNSTISNVTVRNTGHQGLYLSNNSATDVTNLNIINAGRQGIYTRDSSLNATNVNIQDTANQGIYLLRTTADLKDVSVTDAAQQGVLSNNSTSNIENLMIRNAGYQGMYVYNGSTADITNVDIINAGRQGLYTNNATLTASKINVINANNQGLYLYNSSTTLDELRVANSGQQGLYLNNNTTATISNAVISGTKREGIYIRNSDLTLSNASISDIIASANRDGIFIYRNSDVTLNVVSVSNVTGDGLQVHGSASINPTVTANDLSIANVGRYGVVATRGDLTLNNAVISSTTFDGILVNRGNLTVNSATVSNSGRFGVYTLRSNADIQNLTVSNTARDGILANRSDLTLNDSTIRDIGDGDASDDGLQVINSNLSGAGNHIEGTINSGVACRSSGTNTGSISFASGPISSCP